MRRLRTALLLAVLAAVIVGVGVYRISWHPPKHLAVAPFCQGNPASLVPGQGLKVMTWNVQYLAGKRYVFWYERPGARAADERPTPADLAHGLDEVARVVREENPDVLLLQEVDNQARASYYQDQLALLRERLADLYSCSAQAYEFKAAFVPRWHLLGSVGRTVATFSRYRIERAERLQLPLPGNALTQLFAPRPALLSSYLNVADGSLFAVLNTQLGRYHAGSDTQRSQLVALRGRLDRLESQGTPWLLGGDFNALPLGQYRRLEPSLQPYYAPDSDLHLLWERYPMVPSNAQAGGLQRGQWLTYFANGSHGNGPDRTLDYFFHSPQLAQLDARVRQEDTLGISDHLPLLISITLPKTDAKR
ncbi:endonuclease/exonuclease/phosphatase family protein [Pseudomonas typographi]|uniref:Endonuclease/exonuclease/phosphatase family protein n=1 Tax=Pseudomonas typographi TaxID=2715964 RepID=A0ABR7Z637_9PSED|nr:endonuclease/exonuclease/phosphatase family protein [Pseudomonas typographi]MBD1600980.1 endonuclease/exonuclease/phosphatase family protein [Pseudomonas typographi]